ncbi:MBD domain-containing protein [Caerostris darwini]|uniref:MBD domain-containing protein n=1 Tax=Caerostris darwini TaxID=1538125 RepID=A0AAV4STP8_9ARAC|nr:MBD domain-containing protein [Caerostris darwini]
MATIMDNYATRTRRRCVGRISYTDSTETTTPNDEDKKENEIVGSETQPEYDFSENFDDADEEPVTIDLSEFLSENPLLAEPSENVTDSGGALTDCHSQFRVTSSLADPPPVPPIEVSTQKDLNVIGSTAIIENASTTVPISVLPVPPPFPCESSIPVETSNKIVDTVNVINSQVETIFNGVESSISKNHKFKSIVKSNVFDKLKNLSKVGDFNKYNMEVFGKYPVIQCEKLDVERFIKTNNIKIGNWPLSRVNNRLKNKLHMNRNNTAKKLKSIIRKPPKFLNKPITINRNFANSQNGSAIQKGGILINGLPTNSSPLIIRTDNWKSEIVNLTGCSANFINATSNHFLPPISQNLNNQIIGNQRIFKVVQASAPLRNAQNTQMQNLPIIRSGNKSFRIISPKSISNIEKNKSTAVAPILPKPNSETISSLLLNDYTVIQPYVEDKAVPEKPKTLLSAPLDIVPNSNTVNKQENINTISEIQQANKSSIKSIKPVQSVFLNGAIQPISSPIKIGKEYSSPNKSITTSCIDNISVNPSEKKDTKSNGDLSASPLAAVVDAMFKSQAKKQNSSEQNHSPTKPMGQKSQSECQAYNTTLADILFNDVDEYANENDSLNGCIDTSLAECNSNVMLKTLDTCKSNQKGALEVISKNNEPFDNGTHKDKKFLKQNRKRKKDIVSPNNSDTLSASEGEDENNSVRLSYLKPKCAKSSSTLKSEEQNQNALFKKKVNDAVSNKNIVSPDKKNKLGKRNVTNLAVNNPPKFLKMANQECTKSNKINTSKLSSEITDISVKSDINNFTEEKNNILIKDNSRDLVSVLQAKHKQPLKSKKTEDKDCAHSNTKANNENSCSAKIISRNSSKSTDNTKEINVGSNDKLNFGKGLKKKNIKSNRIDDSKLRKIKKKTFPKISNKGKRNSNIRLKSKKKTLKVLFKRPTRQQKLKSLEMPFDEISVSLSDNENDSTSLQENNANCNSVFEDNKKSETEIVNNGKKLCDMGVLSNKLKSTDLLKNNSKKIEKVSNEINLKDSVENLLDTEVKEDANVDKCNDTVSGEVKGIISYNAKELNEKIISEICNASVSEVENFAKSAAKELNYSISNNNVGKSDETLVPEDTSLSEIETTEAFAIQELNCKTTINNANELEESSNDKNCETFTEELQNLSDDINNQQILSEGENVGEDINEIFDSSKFENLIKNSIASILNSIDTFDDAKIQKDTLKQQDVASLVLDEDSVDTLLEETTKNILFPEDLVNCASKHLLDINEQDTASLVLRNDSLDTSLEDTTKNTLFPEDFVNHISEHLCLDIKEDSTITNLNVSVNKETDMDTSKMLSDEDTDKIGSVSEEITERNQNPVTDTNTLYEDTNKINHISEEIHKQKSLDINTQCNAEDKVSSSDNASISLPLSKLSLPEIDVIEKVSEQKQNCKSKRKSCPKIKISVVEPRSISRRTRSSKNWYISERMLSTDSIQSDSKRKQCDDLESRKKKVSSESCLSAIISKNDERIIIETVADVHAVDVDDEMPNDCVPSNPTNINETISTVASIIGSASNDFNRMCMPRGKNSIFENTSRSESDTVALKHIKEEIRGMCDMLAKGSTESVSLVKIEDEILALTKELCATTAETVMKETNSFGHRRHINVITTTVDAIEIQGKAKCKKKVNSRKSTSHSTVKDSSVEQPLKISKIKEERISSGGLSKNKETISNVVKPKRVGAKISNVATPKNVGISSRGVSKIKETFSNVVKPKNVGTKNSNMATPKSVGPKISDVAPKNAETKISNVAKPKDMEAKSSNVATPPFKQRGKNYSPEAVIVPFSLGWMRELVHRSTEGKGKKMSDIYYFSPEGTKLRSMPDISNYLSLHPENEVTLSNFTFAKELVYREPFEIERSAKQKSIYFASSEKKKTNQTTMNQYLQPSTTSKSTLKQTSSLPLIPKSEKPLKRSTPKQTSLSSIPDSEKSLRRNSPKHTALSSTPDSEKSLRRNTPKQTALSLTSNSEKSLRKILQNKLLCHQHQIVRNH